MATPVCRFHGWPCPRVVRAASSRGLTHGPWSIRHSSLLGRHPREGVTQPAGRAGWRLSRLFTSPPAASQSPSHALAGSRLGFARLYLHMLDKRPVLTKSLTAGTIYTMADLASQRISTLQLYQNEAFQWDSARTLRMTFAGLFLSGPSLHLWFYFMSTLFPKRDMLSTLKKMVLGQTLYGPVFTVVFFSLNAYAQGETSTEIVERIKRDFFPTIKSGLMYWPLCDFITYRYIPVHLQPLVSNSFSFIWTIYITYMASLKKVSVEALS